MLESLMKIVRAPVSGLASGVNTMMREIEGSGVVPAETVTTVTYPTMPTVLSAPGDSDLGGDDIKVVEWWVLLMQPGEEQLLAQGVEVVRFPTTDLAFAARKMPAVLEKVAGLTDAEKERFIEFGYDVRLRRPRRAPEYDRKMATMGASLRAIAERF